MADRERGLEAEAEGAVLYRATEERLQDLSTGRVLWNCQAFRDKDLRHPDPQACSTAAVSSDTGHSLALRNLTPRPSQKLPHQLL